MKAETRDKLLEAWAYCDWKDKSTEFMLTYMAKIVPGWDESDVVEWIEKNEHLRDDWYKRNKGWTKRYEK